MRYKGQRASKIVIMHKKLCTDNAFCAFQHTDHVEVHFYRKKPNINFRTIISRIPHVKDIRDDFIEGTPSVKVVVDRQKAALFGLTTDIIGFALKTAYNGLDVSSFREGD
ncbi:MAG: hypothetical protein JSV38_13100 [Desulfobacterales bacterium]|nr:MAG: hypothetical protein JSV38_13100 [Desulfobacterales bacterium]